MWRIIAILRCCNFSVYRACKVPFGNILSAWINRPTPLNLFTENDIYQQIWMSNIFLSLGLDQEGIYRVSGVKSKIEELKYMYDHGKALSIFCWSYRLKLLNMYILLRILLELLDKKTFLLIHLKPNSKQTLFELIYSHVTRPWSAMKT